MSRELLFSLTKKDFRIDYYRASGKGGQKRNKTNSAARITHIASGAVGNCSEFRMQGQNRKVAFKRLTESTKFKLWMKIETASVVQGKRETEIKINAWVDEQIKPENVKVESI